MSDFRVPRSGPTLEAVDDYALEIALSKARAARILLRADADYLQIPISLKPGESEAEIRGWIQNFAFEALDAALEEAEVARAKILGPPRWGKRKVVAR